MTDVGRLSLQEQHREISFLALRIRQPIGEFFIAAISSKKMVDICWFDIRKIKGDQLEDFTGIQREIDPKRVAQIKRYVRGTDPTFPTAIVIAVDERCARIDVAGSQDSSLVRMTIRNHTDPEPGLDPVLYREIARVIDGQHRLEGLRDFSDEFELNVAIFIGIDVATAASIFSTVNLAQTKVNKSLVYDLFSYEEAPSPEKMCHSVAVTLDAEEGSPFYRRIKRLGVATDGRFGETLSQATFVKGIIQYVSKDVIADRDAGKRNKPFPKVPASQRSQLFLRDFFVDDADDVIADILWNYFDIVREKWPKAWDETGKGWVLNKTAGYAGLMRFLRPAYLSYVAPGEILSKEWFRKIFETIHIPETYWMSSNIRPGTSGEKYVYDALLGAAQLGPREWTA